LLFFFLRKKQLGFVAKISDTCSYDGEMIAQKREKGENERGTNNIFS
jgi:hypothetical protein